MLTVIIVPMSQTARQTEEQNVQRRAQILGLQYTDTSTVQKQFYKDLLPNELLYQMRIIPLVADANNLTFGVTNTTSRMTMEQLRARFQDQRISFVLISDAGFREYMQLYDPPKKVVYQDISLNSTTDDDLFKQISSMLEQVKADDMLAYLVQQAHRLNASDIHIETQKDYVRIRLRIDGVLHPIAQLSAEKYRMLISAIASSGNISTSSKEAQQGHIAQRVTMADGATVDVNLRLETVPTINDMDVVMRLFNMDQDMYNLDRLGLDSAQRAVVDDIISKPSGLVLIVGPTGSGKTTTLYSMLNSLNSDERKIITIEDPVEYQFEGITQISVTTGNTGENSFADRLRAVLRLDPDIVMVGEVRDMDTAKTALQASLTGHLVLSTFHGSSAAAAISRLMDIIGQNPLFVSAIRLIMAQRLVRRLDNNTKQAYTPDEKTMEGLHRIIESLPPGIDHPDLTNVQLFQPGTSPENPYGYKGQIALREQFTMNGEIRALLEHGGQPSAQEIEQAAIASGMMTMLQEGVIRALAGETSLEEVLRVVG